jgi:DNA-binding winged helix-turn-helix (wHTH) protein
VRALTRRTVAADHQAETDPRGLVLEPDRRRAYFDGNDLHCTAIEFAILRELAGVAGQVLSHRYLNQRIWSYPNLEDGTLLKNHVRNLRRKLADAGAPADAIRSAHGVGYTLADSVAGTPSGSSTTRSSRLPDLDGDADYGRSPGDGPGTSEGAHASARTAAFEPQLATPLA